MNTPASLKTSTGSIPVTHVPDSEEELAEEVISYIWDLLMDKLMEAMYESYKERQTINIAVHCAHKALEKLISMYFYPRNPYDKFYNPSTTFESEKPLTPMAADSWASNQMIISDSKQQRVTPSNLEQKIEQELALCQGSPSTITMCPNQDEREFDAESYLSSILDRLTVYSHDSIPGSPRKFEQVACGYLDYDEYLVKTGASKFDLEREECASEILKQEECLMDVPKKKPIAPRKPSVILEHGQPQLTKEDLVQKLKTKNEKKKKPG